MTASANDRRLRRPALAAAGVLLLAAVPAAARGAGPPIPLVPRHPPRSAQATLTSAISSRPLPAPAAGWSGDVARPRRPLPRDFWQGTPRSLAERLLARLPETTSPALQSLARRLLLSRGAPPAGRDQPGQPLAALRAAALLRLGELDAAKAVAKAAPRDERPALRPLRAAADAIAGHTGRACTLARHAVKSQRTAYWQRTVISCEALAGKAAEARLGLQVLAAEKKSDAALAAAVEALAKRAPPAPITALDHSDPLLLRLIVKARLPLDPKLIDRLPPQIALGLALDDHAPPVAQLAAAERAARFGALPPSGLIAVYKGTAGQLAGATGGAAGDARRFAALGKAPSAADRLGRILAFVKHFTAGQKGGFVLAARLVWRRLHAITPDHAQASGAAAAARLAIAAGHPKLAQRWAALATGDARRRLDFVLALAAAPDATGSDPAGGDPGNGDPGHKGNAGPLPLRIALLAGLGRPVPAADWAHLPAGLWRSAEPAGPAAPRLILAAARSDKGAGATVLAAVILASAKTRLSRDPLSLEAALAGLLRAGLGADARRLATEVALAGGL